MSDDKTCHIRTGKGYVFIDQPDFVPALWSEIQDQEHEMVLYKRSPVLHGFKIDTGMTRRFSNLMSRFCDILVLWKDESGHVWHGYMNAGRWSNLVKEEEEEGNA